MPPCSPFGARMRWPEPAYTEQSQARPGARPTKGGAVRIRIALATAVAVTIITVVIFALSNSNPPASAKAVHGAVRHTAASRHRDDAPGMKLMSYSQAEKLAKLATFYNAVTVSQEENYLNEVAYLKALQGQKMQAALQAIAAQRAAAQRVAVATPAPVATAPASAGSGSDASSTNTPDWACIREHESGDNYGEYNGGAYQFELGTWEALTGLATPAQDSPAAVQDSAALRLYAERGWEPWTTRFVCGL
jgi:Transglycosylase-like domain